MTASEVGPAADPEAPDPDPTPTATPWQEYLAAAQSLDAVAREAGAASAAAARATDAVRADLARIQERLDRQRAWLVGEAVRAGLRSPRLSPTPAELAAAQAQVAMADPAAVAEALRRCQQLLDLADAQLTPAPPGPTATPPVAVPPPASAPPAAAPPPPATFPAAPVPASPAPLTGQIASQVTGQVTGQIASQVTGQVSPVNSPVPPDRSWWPPPVWLLVAVPLGAATLFLFVFTILVAVLR